MSWAAAVTAIKAHMAAGFTAWPVAWPNEEFPEPRDDGGKPINTDGTPKSFVECEIIGGDAGIRGVGKVGERLTIQPGLIRAYLATPRGTGTATIDAKAWAIASLFNRVEIATGAANCTVRCEDASVHGDVFEKGGGNLYAVMVSVPFDLYFLT